MMIAVGHDSKARGLFMIRFRLKELIMDVEFKTGRRMTLGQVAAETGIKQPTLSRIAGTRGYNTTTDNIDKLCKFFGCKVSDLMEYIPDEELELNKRL
jgi:putative transcriptional regulator